MNPQTLKLHAVVLSEVPAEDTRALLREAADALQAGQDLARAVRAVLGYTDSHGIVRAYPATVATLARRVEAVLGEPVLDVEPDDASPRPGTPEAARRARNTTRHPAEWGKPE